MEENDELPPPMNRQIIVRNVIQESIDTTSFRFTEETGIDNPQISNVTVHTLASNEASLNMIRPIPLNRDGSEKILAMILKQPLRRSMHTTIESKRALLSDSNQRQIRHSLFSPGRHMTGLAPETQNDDLLQSFFD